MFQTNPHNPIASKDNERIKRLLALSLSKTRKKEKAFLIEGVKIVEEALRDNLGVKLVVATPSLMQHHGKGVLKLAESRGIDVLWVTGRLMDSLSDSKTPQPVMAVVEMKQYSHEDLLGHPAGIIIIADQLQDPGNFGTITRTAEAAGASGVAVTPNTVDPFNAKAVRASMGSILRVPLLFINDLAAFLSTCKQRGFQTVATVLTAEVRHFDVDFRKRTALVFGKESAGLPGAVLQGMDLLIRIPMAATIDSLNVATAAAVVLYEAVRQRSGK